jgi:Presenilin enhancer-2 subunit of gamma secretase
MRSDVLSKRLFYVGCFGLPWLWTVHVLHHWKADGTSSESASNDEALLNPDDRKCDNNDSIDVFTTDILLFSMNTDLLYFLSYYRLYR